MKKNILFTFSFWTILILSSCSTDNQFSKDQMLTMAEKADPGLRLVLPSDELPAVDCNDYGEGCDYGVHVRVKGIMMRVVRFQTERLASLAALRRQTYFARNWIFDTIQEEPLLIDFVVKVYQAQYAPDYFKKKKQEIIQKLGHS